MIAGLKELPEVRGVMHTRIAPPLAGRAASYAERVQWLCDELCAQLNQVEAHAPGRQRLHVVCTTCMSPMLTGSPTQCEQLADQILVRCGVRTAGWLQPYQCAGWGYALRFAAQLGSVRHLTLSIVDADLHDAVSAAYRDAIGAIGFGVTTIDLTLPQPCALPQCGGPHANRAFNEFLHAIKTLHRQHGARPTFIPFLPDGFAGIAERMIGRDALAPNRHAAYGHTFGADPWIGLIEWFQTRRPDDTQTVTLGAFAYDGYYTVCDFSVPPTLQTHLATVRFDAPQCVEVSA